VQRAIHQEVNEEEAKGWGRAGFLERAAGRDTSNGSNGSISAKSSFASITTPAVEPPSPKAAKSKRGFFGGIGRRFAQRVGSNGASSPSTPPVLHTQTANQRSQAFVIGAPSVSGFNRREEAVPDVPLSPA